MLKKIYHFIANKNFVSRIYPNRINIIEQVINNAILQDFIRNRFASDCKKFNHINFEDEFSYIIESFIQAKSIVYMEFGVWKGKSIEYATKRNTHPESIFVGFDTFTGLPEKWDKQYLKGTFDVGGQIPIINDERLIFIKGLFQETLPKFLQSDEWIVIKKRIEDSVLVLNMDADLYSSTLYVLTMLNNIIKPGTIIRFDEFGVLTDECMAFRDYTRAYYRNFEIVGFNESLRHVIVRITT